MSKHALFSPTERALSFLAGLVNLVVGLGFFFLPELHSPLWPTSIPPILDRFIGAIILGNAAGAFWLSTEREWARVRPLAIVAVVYGTLVAFALLYHLLWLGASSSFWIYLVIDVPFLLVYYGLFIYHDVAPRMSKRAAGRAMYQARKQARKWWQGSMQAPFADPLSGVERLSSSLPLVGREGEMQLLRNLLDTVEFERPYGPRALLMSGEMGIGKTRLLAEMCQEASDRGFRLLAGRAYEVS